jgi:ATP-dependent RNA helicase SUPV3L1/SUV3
MDAELGGALCALRPGDAAQQALFPYFAQFVLERYVDDIKAYRDMVHSVDLRNPHQWFPMARALQRR